MGSTPYSPSWGYPIQSWPGGTPSSPGLGVSHPALLREYPIQSWQGGTLSSPGWEYPHQLDGIPPSPACTWNGVPPPPGPGMGYPLSRPGTGYPPSRPGMGYACVHTWDGVPPPPSRCGLTNKLTCGCGR